MTLEVEARVTLTTSPPAQSTTHYGESSHSTSQSSNLECAPASAKRRNNIGNYDRFTLAEAFKTIGFIVVVACISLSLRRVSVNDTNQ